MKIEELNLGRKYYLPVKVTNFECETNSTEVVVTLESLSRRHQLVDFGTNIMNELVEIDLKNSHKHIEPDKPKPEVPQFVADWIEICDMRFVNLNYIFGENCPKKVKEWISVYGNHKKMLQALLYDYTVEKEKLYTVEIPNPNSAGGKLVLFKQQSAGRLILDMLNPNINKPKYLHLTESEIKQNFEWAWQFAKEVEE